jgi:hypothetical protein
MEERVKEITKRLGYLEEQRKPWEAVWNKAAEMCSVNSKIYVKDAKNKIIQKNFDGTARNALNTFTAALKSVLIPTNTIWHKLKPTNPRFENNDNTKRYLEYVNDLLFKVRYAPNSRFTSEATVQLKQMGIYGQAAWLIEDDIGRGIVYRSIPMNEIYLDINRLGVVDVVYRKYELTARQALQEFGSRATSKIKEKAEKDPDRKMTFLHAVEPRKDRNIRRKDATNMPIASYHIDLDNNEMIYESGYRVNPYMVPHFDTIPGSAYGSSPALQAFDDILCINEMQKTALRSGQLAANPTILVGSDIKNAANIGQPGAVVRGLDANGRPQAVPMQYGANLSITLEMQQEIKAIIEKAFLVPLFQSLAELKDLRDVRAYVVQQKIQERAMLLAPTSELISSEWLIGNVRREIDILSQYGYLDDVPDELMYDGSIDIEFESPAVHMQQAASITGLMEWLESVMGMAQVNPGILDIVDFEQAARSIADYKGVATKILRTPEQVQALGEQRAQMEQAQALLAAAPAISQTVKNMGDTNGNIQG